MQPQVRSWDELVALQAPDIHYYLQPQLLSHAGSMIVYGAPETYKSWAGLELAYSIGEAVPWLGMFKTSKARVLLVQTEQSELMYRDRVVGFSRSLNGSTPKNVFIYTDIGIQLDSGFGVGLLEIAIKQSQPHVVILDNLYNTITSESDQVVIKRFLDGIKILQQKYETAFVITAHTRKEQGGHDFEDKGFEEMSGHSSLGRWADTILRVYAESKREDLIRLSFQKTRLGLDHLDDVRIRWDRQKTRLVWY